MRFACCRGMLPVVVLLQRALYICQRNWLWGGVHGKIPRHILRGSRLSPPMLGKQGDLSQKILRNLEHISPCFESADYFNDICL